MRGDYALSFCLAVSTAPLVERLQIMEMRRWKDGVVVTADLCPPCDVIHVSGSHSLESEVDSEIQVDTRPVTPMMLACSSSRASLPTMSPPMTPRYVNSRTLDRRRPCTADRLISSIVRSLHFADTFISDGQLCFAVSHK